jgi:hypothetical protein
MSLTDTLVGAAAVWLLLVACGIPGDRSRAPLGTVDDVPLAGVAIGRGADITRYSVWHQETPQPRHVPPPRPADGPWLVSADDTNPLALVPANVYTALGAAPVDASRLPQTLSLTEIEVVPGSMLTLADLGGSGLIVLEAGWLELARRDGNARLTRSPRVESPAPWETESAPTLAPGDHLAFGPGATIVLRNRGESPARVLTATVLGVPGSDL